MTMNKDDIAYKLMQDGEITLAEYAYYINRDKVPHKKPKGIRLKHLVSLAKKLFKEEKPKGYLYKEGKWTPLY